MTYSFEDGVLTIHDEGLGIDFTDTFTPAMIPSQRKEGQVLPNGRLLRYTALEGGGATFWLDHNGIIDGEAITLYPSGTIKSRSYYFEGMLHGPSRHYGTDGVLLSESWYWRGNRQGTALWYYFDGALYSRQRFKDGRWCGLQEYFHSNGAVKSQTTH